jgi:hypothetical protein
MTDLVSYLLPFQPFGQLVAPWVRKRLEYIFDFRHRILASMFQGLDKAP